MHTQARRRARGIFAVALVALAVLFAAGLPSIVGWDVASAAFFVGIEDARDADSTNDVETLAEVYETTPWIAVLGALGVSIVLAGRPVVSTRARAPPVTQAVASATAANRG